MLDIKFVRENPEVVKQNIRNKFQWDRERSPGIFALRGVAPAA